MPARRKEPDSWWSEPEAAPAADAHIGRDESPEPLFDPLLERNDEERPEARFGASHGEERTEVIPRGLRATDPERETTPVPARGRRRARPAVRRVRRTLSHVDPLSVLKLSLVFYGCVLVLWLLFVAIVYGFLSSAGLFDAVERLGRTAVLWEGFEITLWTVERWALIAGAALALVASLVNVFVAFLYNLAADIVGGAEMTFVERDL